MPLGKSVKANLKEMMADNKKKGKERGMNGKPRSMRQMLAISYAAAGKSKNKNGRKKK